jgi:hypothetical protein
MYHPCNIPKLKESCDMSDYEKGEYEKQQDEVRRKEFNDKLSDDLNKSHGGNGTGCLVLILALSSITFTLSVITYFLSA